MLDESALSLVERLRATLNEHERVARAAVERHGGVVPTSATEYILRTVAAHRKILERYETAVIARDAAVDTPLAGATRMALRLAGETLEIIAAVYFPEETTDGTE